MTDVPSVNFDRAAGFYDLTRPVDDTELTQTLDLLHRSLDPSGTTLEIGVGTGALALPLAERGWHITGVDISAAMLSKLVEKVAGAPPIALVRADATALPFADASVGGAYVRHVFHLVPRWRDVVAELCRVTEGSVAIALGTVPGPWHDLWYAMRPVLGPEADHVGLDFAAGGDEQLREALIAHGAVFEEEATIDHPAHETVAGFLGAVQGRAPSWTWRVPEETLNAALDVGRRWTVERYGTTDIRLEERVRQRWWVFEIS